MKDDDIGNGQRLPRILEIYDLFPFLNPDISSAYFNGICMSRKLAHGPLLSASLGFLVFIILHCFLICGPQNPIPLSFTLYQIKINQKFNSRGVKENSNVGELHHTSYIAFFA